MAVRYDADFNKEIRRVVKNFNAKRNRMTRRGYTEIPPIMKVSELKARYANRRELRSELARLEAFNQRKDSVKEVETSGGAKAIKWELDYIKSNLDVARDYWDRRIKDLSKREKRFPAERGLLDNAISNRQSLEIDIAYMNQDQFKAMKGAVIHSLKAPHWTARNYRGFLSEVEAVMRAVGYDSKTINNFIDKFSVLNPDQFLRLYNTNDLIGRIYEIADSPTYGGFKLNVSKDEAKERIDSLLERTDEMVNEALEYEG